MSITTTKYLAKILSPSLKGYSPFEKYVDSPEESQWGVLDFFLILIDIAFLVWAVWLSWTSNTIVGWNTPYKFLYAILAALFGGLYYVIYYTLFRADYIFQMSILKK